MKWMLLFVALLGSGGLAPAVAQDAATQERLDKLSGQIEDLVAAQRAQQKQIEAMVKELADLREQSAKPNGAYASQEDLKHLADAVKDVDRARQEDFEKIRAELKNLGRTVSSATAAPPRSRSTSEGSERVSDKGFEYVVKKGDTLSLIVQAYRDNNIKVTMDQVLKANPGLKPERMQVGQKLFIPAP